MIAIGEYTISEIFDGEKGEQGVSVSKVVTEWTKSTSSTTLPSNPTWSETKPSITSGEYLWYRDRTDLNNGTSTYSNAVCDVVISGVLTDVDSINNKITNKVWESDITSKINQYDGSTVSTIRDRVAKNETDITGITTRVSDVESETDDLGTRITSAESSITQNANNINLKVSKDSVISEINASPESITISADKVNIEGATIFSSGRLSQTSLNNAYDAKGSAATAKTEAINSANSATDTKLQSYSTTSQMNTAIGTAVNNAVDDIEANAIKSTVSCYYRSTSNTAPTITKTTSIGTSNNTDNAWEYVMPVPKRNTYFFTCEKYTYMDDSVAFSTVRPLDSQTYASKWVSSSDNTYVDGGRIYTHSITTSQLATDAIKSNNYSASQNANSPYSATGTFLDLSTGNFYTPNFGIDNTYGKAYLNGEIIASSGQIGSDTMNYWEIGNKTDYNANDSAAIIGHGSSYIQSGGWMISADRIDTRSYDSNRKYTYPLNDNTYWDFGLHVPNLTSNEVYDNNFIYIRNHESTIPTLEGNWNYLFRVDRNGGIEATGLKINGTTIQDMITAGVDGGAYLPTSGGTISGNLTVTGTISGLKTLSINGRTYNGTSAVDVGVIGAAYGGTGQSSLINSANALINALSTGSSTPTDNDYYVSQYVGGGTTTTTYHRRPMSALWTYIKSKINADSTLMTDKFIPKTGGEFTGAITVSDSFTADEATVGNLIVNGAGRFTNGLYGDLTGTATKAAKVVDSGNGHDTTFAYSKDDMTSTNWIAVWNDYELRAMSPANLLTTIGAQPAGNYVSKTGDTMTGNLTGNGTATLGSTANPFHQLVLGGATNATVDATSTNPRITFQEGTGTQPVHLIYSDYDSYRNPAGLKIVGGASATPAWLEVEGTVYAPTFSGSLSGNAASATKATQDSDGNVINTTYLKLSGGTITGQIKKAGSGGNWQSGRDRALIFMNSLNGYSTLASMKTNNGSWDIGAYSDSNFTDDLIFSYVKDTTYSGTNTTDAQIKFLENGHIVASGFDGTATKANSLASNISIAVGNKTVSNINAGSTASYALADIAKDISDSSAPDRGWMTKELYTTITNMAQNFDGGTITVSNVTASNGLSYNYNSSTGITSITGTYPIPTTAGTSGQVLIADSNGKGVWNNQSNLKIRRLDNKFTSRPTDANITSSADRAGSLELLLSTGAMTSHKPSKDGYILHMNWDNLNWDSQLYIPSENAHPQWRYMNNGTWGNWTTFLDSGNYNSYSPTLTGTGASGTWGINITGSAGSVSASNITEGYIATHPEKHEKVVLPFIYNDLAHLITRGYACAAMYFSTAPSNYTATTLSGGVDISSSILIDRLFDTSPYYCGSVGNNSGTKTSNDIVVFDITMPRLNYYSTYYIDFGYEGWRAKNIAFYLMNSSNDSAYTLASSTTTNAKSFYYFSYQGGGTGVDRLRVVVTDWNSATDHRIAQIGAINYSSNGARVGYMSTGVDDPIYRSITPANNSTYNLGSSSKKWNYVYADNFVGTATKATQDGSGNTITSTYLKKTGDIMTGILQMEAQLKTSFKSSVATGSYQATATTIETLCEELRYSSGVMGSVNITTAYTKDNITIPTQWYNFLWIPHRSGGVNGTASGDNCNYGSLYLSGMTNTGLYMIRYASSAIAEVKNLYNPPSATKATQDGDGNTISSSYLKLSGGTMTGAINLPYNKQSVSFRSDNASYDSGFVYGTNGNEALALVQQQDVTSFMVVHGSDPSTWTNTTWQSASPTIQTKNKSLYVNERINHGSTPSYNFKVNGTSYLGGNVRISNSNADTASCELQFNSTLDCLEFIFN